MRFAILSVSLAAVALIGSAQANPPVSGGYGRSGGSSRNGFSGAPGVVSGGIGRRFTGSEGGRFRGGYAGGGFRGGSYGGGGVPFGVSRGWDYGHRHFWNNRSYGWDGGGWVIFDGGEDGDRLRVRGNRAGRRQRSPGDRALGAGRGGRSSCLGSAARPGPARLRSGSGGWLTGTPDPQRDLGLPERPGAGDDGPPECPFAERPRREVSAEARPALSSLPGPPATARRGSCRS